MSSASGSDDCLESGPSVNNMALWMEATGGVKKGEHIWDGIVVKDVHAE